MGNMYLLEGLQLNESDYQGQVADWRMAEGSHNPDEHFLIVEKLVVMERSVIMHVQRAQRRKSEVGLTSPGSLY
jgi:hypothetical protein